MSDLYSTRAAAHYLGVSEASVRRWSDAGLLRVQRAGRRGTRRFAEADLQAFAAKSGFGLGELQPPGAQVVIHGHFATFYDGNAARMRLALPFLRAGLQAGERCFLVATEPLAGEYRAALSQELESGPERSADLVIRETVGATPRAAVEWWEELWVDALAAGSRAMRVVGEMSVYKALDEGGQLLDYEVAYDNVAKRYPVMTLCQYDVRHFDGVEVLGALKAHPDLFTRRISDFVL